ncbi:MAG: hypothetical protein MR609_01210 [Bacteroidales bacterium]|nr:hypothetical protein [Bacteroidales bacterium]
MNPPLPHTSTANAVFVWGYQDSARCATLPLRGESPYERPYGCRTIAPIGAKDRVSGQKVVAPYEDRSAVDVRGNGNAPLFPVFDPYGGRTNMIVSRYVLGVSRSLRGLTPSPGVKTPRKRDDSFPHGSVGAE